MRMKNSVSIASRVYRLPPKRAVTEPSMYFTSEHLSRLLNTPPMISKNAITAIVAPLPSAVKISTGEKSHLKNPIPPSTNVKPASVSMTVFPFASVILAYSPPGMIKVSTYVSTISTKMTAIAVMKLFALILSPFFSLLSMTVSSKKR